MSLLLPQKKPRSRGRSSLRFSALSVTALCSALACSPAAVADAPASEDNEESSAEVTGEDISLGDGDANIGDPGKEGYMGTAGAGGAPSQACLSFMSWGSVAQQGAVPGQSGMDAIVSWLTESSTATGEHFAQQPEITEEFLAPYDVILLQNLSGWEFSEEEVSIFKEWVRAGGGVMSLSGYQGDPGQVMATNRLLSFTGMNYVSVSEAGDTSTSLGVCGYCLGTTDRQEGWNEEHPIAAGITAVGAFGGRSIQGSGEIVAQEEGKVLGMTVEVDAGRVFLFHDDWVSYHGAWSANAPGDCIQNMECSGVSPRETYQVPRFWYNSFDWLAGGRECFVVDDLDGAYGEEVY